MLVYLSMFFSLNTVEMNVNTNIWQVAHQVCSLSTLPMNVSSETPSSYGRVEEVKGWGRVEGREGEGGVRESCGDCLSLVLLKIF